MIIRLKGDLKIKFFLGEKKEILLLYDRIFNLYF